MPRTGKSAALSHVGRIRANNQDSGYAGKHLFVVADGMGGHAGGDVASAIAIKRIAEADRPYGTIEEAEHALQSALHAANTLIAETVFDHAELTGMGTTVSGMIRVGNQVALAHIGDSRIYRLRDGELDQLSTDHTFVQRLVDSGRITQEEAAVHPRRNVLMRVLGDIDSAPEIDTTTLTTAPGDVWLMCSDGLSSYVSDDRIRNILKAHTNPKDAANRLIKEALDHGAPDNVTVVVVSIGDDEYSGAMPPQIVGSAALPLTYEAEIARKALRLPTLLLHPLKSNVPEDSHFEPESEEYLDELLLEHRRRAIRHKVSWLIAIILMIGAITIALILGYRWTQTHYFIGAYGDTVAIYQGVQQDLGPIKLSSVYQQTSISLESLPPYTRSSVIDTLNANSLEHAREILERIEELAR